MLRSRPSRFTPSSDIELHNCIQSKKHQLPANSLLADQADQLRDSMLRLIQNVKDPEARFESIDRESVTLALAIKDVLISADLLQERDVKDAFQGSESTEANVVQALEAVRECKLASERMMQCLDAKGEGQFVKEAKLLINSLNSILGYCQESGRDELGEGLRNATLALIAAGKLWLGGGPSFEATESAFATFAQTLRTVLTQFVPEQKPVIQVSPNTSETSLDDESESSTSEKEKEKERPRARKASSRRDKRKHEDDSLEQILGAIRDAVPDFEQNWQGLDRAVQETVRERVRHQLRSQSSSTKLQFLGPAGGRIGQLEQRTAAIPLIPIASVRGRDATGGDLTLMEKLQHLTGILLEIAYKFINNTVAYAVTPAVTAQDRDSLQLLRKAMLEVLHQSKAAYWNPQLKRHKTAQHTSRQMVVAPKKEPSISTEETGTAKTRRIHKVSTSSAERSPPATVSKVTILVKSFTEVLEDTADQLDELAQHVKKNLSEEVKLPTADSTYEECARSNPNAPKLIEENLKASTFDRARELRGLVVQLLYGLNNIMHSPHLLEYASDRPYDDRYCVTLLQVTACLSAIDTACLELMQVAENYKFVSTNLSVLKAAAQQGDLGGADKLDDIEAMFKAEIKQRNIWDDVEEATQATFGERRKKATLNQLIDALCSDVVIDQTFIRTFVTTYQSFTTPLTLFEKLNQRWFVPSRIPRERTIRLQIRVGIVLKYWIEHRFDDFTEDLLTWLNKFLDTTIAREPAHTGLASMLAKLVQEKTKERSLGTFQAFSLAPILAPESKMSPSEIFLALSDSEIARQLTMLEFGIFEKITPSELLNQAWNKPKLRYRAPNVLALIARTNMVIQWVGNLICWPLHKAERAAMLIKILTVAGELRRLNNFNSLMSIVAALNSASVKRLAATMAEVPRELLASFRRWDDEMTATSAYARYREILAKSVQPSLPYLGTWLTDITFIEDGNPDEIEGLINFQKRMSEEDVLLKIEQYQQVKYNFPLVEPIQTFLLAMPRFSENPLYKISLLREPRDLPPEAIY